MTNATAPLQIEAAAPDNSLTIDAGGNVTVAGDVTVNSDARLKQNIRPLAGALTLVSRLDGRTYEWKPATGRDPGRKVGLIAQEVEIVMPELVSENSDGIKSVNYSGLVPVLINALKEQQREIAMLKSQHKEIEVMKEQLLRLTEQLTANR